MKLFYSPASPFARKVVVLAQECGVSDQIENLAVSNTAVAQDVALMAANPLGKIPALVLNDGSALYDSRVICQYLDSLHDGAPFYPTDLNAKWQVLRLEALCDGIADAALIARYEQALRPDPLFWADWFNAQLDKVRHGIAELEKDLHHLEGPINIAQIAAACTLEYVTFRHSTLDWQSSHPKLTNWLDVFNERASMQNTRTG